MKTKLKKDDFLVYISQVETAIETFLYCDLPQFEYLKFLIDNVPSIRQAAGSIGKYQGLARKALLTSTGRQAVNRINNSFTGERSRSIANKQTELDEGIKSTHNCVRKKATNTMEKIDNIERTIINKLLEVQNDLTINLGEDLDKIIAMLEEHAAEFAQFAERQDQFFEETKTSLNRLQEQLTTLIDKVTEIKDSLDNLDTKIDVLQRFVDNYQTN